MSNTSNLYIDFHYIAAVNDFERRRLQQSPSECSDVIHGHEARGMHSNKEWETVSIFWWKYMWWMEWIFGRNEKDLWRWCLLRWAAQWVAHLIDYTEMSCPSVPVWGYAFVTMSHWPCTVCYFRYEFPLRVVLIVSLHVFQWFPIPLCLSSISNPFKFWIFHFL